MTTIDATRTLTVITCGECGIDFAVPEHWREARVADHAGFYCPNGHCRAYQGETREEKLKRQLDQTARQLARTQDDLHTTEARRRAAKGQLTKTKRRIANGVCPCCQRHLEVSNEGEGPHTFEPQDWQEPGPATICYRELWDERDGTTYDVIADGSVIGLYHRSIDGTKIPAGIFWALVKVLEDEGVRP